MFMVASSVVSTILILNYHHRNADTHVMSEWVSKHFDFVSIQMKYNEIFNNSSDSCCIFVLVTMHFTDEPTESRGLRIRKGWKEGGPTAKCRIERTVQSFFVRTKFSILLIHKHPRNRSSKSLLANVLDIDDDFRCNHRCTGATLPHQPTYYRTVYRWVFSFKFTSFVRLPFNVSQPMMSNHKF